MTVRIGTSGWVYEHWRGTFYPEKMSQSQWFAFYAGEFDTVEINNSFYRLPSESAFDAWREQAPDGFLYAVKASRYLTHMKKLKDPEQPLATFLERADHLQAKLGPILYQLPPHWHADIERLEHFCSILPKGYQHVVEFRDPSWVVAPVFAVLERYLVAHCIHDMYTIDVPMRVTAPPVYIRFHGDREHAGEYPLSSMERWADHIREWDDNSKHVFVYFNNDVGGHALKNARQLKSALGI